MNRRTLVNNNEAPTKTLTKSISKKTKYLAEAPSPSLCELDLRAHAVCGHRNERENELGTRRSGS